MSKVKIDLKEAIAEAKTIKEVALSNAKKALEENFHPKLQNMLAAKLNEMDDLDGFEDKEFLDAEDAISEEELDDMLGEMQTLGDDEEIDIDALLSEVDDAEEDSEDEDEDEDESEKDESEEEDEDEEDEDEEDMKLEDMTIEDLKALIADIASEIVSGSETEEVDMDMSVEEMPEEGDLEMEELDESSHMSDEDVSLDEILAELDEIDSEEDPSRMEELMNENKKLKKDLHEVNLLNSKLIYFSKLLKENTLLEDQKIKILNAFDKATTVKETKLVFETLNESITAKKSKVGKRSLTENFGYASKPSGIRRNESIIEVDPAVARMQKLAGLS
jgi:hypothetical protein